MTTKEDFSRTRDRDFQYYSIYIVKLFTSEIKIEMDSISTVIYTLKIYNITEGLMKWSLLTQVPNGGESIG
jgi:hypothetical protein